MPNPPQLNELLHWAVENTPTSNSNASTAIAPLSSSTQTDPIPLSINFNPSPNSSLSVLNPTPKKLDTGILDAILGRSDALRIRESIEIFEDVHQSLNLRTQAGEHLEELVEDLDNANDLEVLGVWPRLIKLLRSDELLIRFHACWICGTAVQNNPKSQIAFLKHDPIPILLDILTNVSDVDTQAKALYCLSSALKHAPVTSNALQAFTEGMGWDALNTCLKGPSMNLRRKTVFLINSLAMQSASIISSLRTHGLLHTLVTSVSPLRGIPAGLDGELSPQDEDYTEKALRAITTVILQAQADELSAEEKAWVQDLVIELGPLHIRQHHLEGAGVAESEWDEVLERIGASKV